MFFIHQTDSYPKRQQTQFKKSIYKFPPILDARLKNHITFAMLLGVLGIYSPAEIIPYEPDMYNNSAGKRFGIHCFVGLNKAVSLCV